MKTQLVGSVLTPSSTFAKECEIMLRARFFWLCVFAVLLLSLPTAARATTIAYDAYNDFSTTVNTAPRPGRIGTTTTAALPRVRWPQPTLFSTYSADLQRAVQSSDADNYSWNTGTGQWPGIVINNTGTAQTFYGALCSGGRAVDLAR